ncbi:hypothetical protein ACFOEK_14790 [Litoribrevibacter euphylliae]|uniref:Solute-binding protein family 3/N-terminal domain-containing protein n=1 Tax=Litoribrevibacter euphylliae TaxID=1834034 RepID=A0ABV7HJG9_9GAMM
MLVCTSTISADEDYGWHTFNIPPYGSRDGKGIGFDLVGAYVAAGLTGRVVNTNTARWQRMMQDKHSDICSSGSWKLPNTEHRVYSHSIMNTVDYGVAVRSELYQRLSNQGKTRVVSIVDVLEATKTGGSMLIMEKRPLFGEMARIVEKAKADPAIKVHYITVSQGPVSMLRITNTANRDVDSALLFPEEFQNFVKEYPDHSLEYLMLKEGTSFAPIRASCPDTEAGKQRIARVNRLLDQGLREQVFKSFQSYLPDFKEIRLQAEANQRCIETQSCKDPLIELFKNETTSD